MIHLKYIMTNKSSWLRNKIPLSGDMTVAFELERLGLNFIDEWDLINPHEIKKNCDDSYSLVKKWWGDDSDTIKYEDFSLGEAAEIDLSYSFQCSLNARSIYGNLFDSYPVDTITGFFKPSVGVVRTSFSTRSVSQSILFYMAKDRGVKIKNITLPSS
jgi:hypothetical protein